MMELVSVDSAKHTASAALELTVTYVDDAGEQRSDPYGWLAGDPFGLGPQIDEWMAAHPDFSVANYVPPIITPGQVDAETNRRMTAITADALMRLQVLGTPIPDSVKSAAQAIDARGTAIKAMVPIPEDFTNGNHWS